MRTALILFALFNTFFAFPLNSPSNLLAHCRASTNLTALEVLPGGGWDNLRNMDMGRVMNLSYSQCQTTEDGLYLIPDEVFVIPQKQTGVETSSEIISSWMEDKSLTSFSINVEASFLSMLNGKFSTGNQRMKKHQVHYTAKTARVQVRDFIYTVKTNPYLTLNSAFSQQVIDIADAIENNQTKNAAYLSEKMVMDYGTHVITSVDAGASLVEEDYLSSKYVSDNAVQGFDLKAQASFHFFDLIKFDDKRFSIGGETSKQNSSLETYQSNIQHSIKESHGGEPFYEGMTVQKWQESTRNNLVAIDRSGVPLHYIINPKTFPDLPEPTVEKIAQSIKQAIQLYYGVNSRPGCVDVNSKNFNFQANVDDASCEGPSTNLSFGGVYQECVQISKDAGPLCDKLGQKNPDTGDFSCRSPYAPTLLRSEDRQEHYTLSQCHTETVSGGWYDCFGWFSSDKQVCQDNYYVRSARINTYWCSVNENAPDNSGYLFGGLYGPSVLNPITNSKGCPSDFIPLNFLSDGMMICVSRNYESGSQYAVTFGGLFSCKSANPLANNHHSCPPKFSQHLAVMSDGCEIFYCVQSKSFTEGELKAIQLPPFTNLPLVRMEANNTVTIMTEGEKNWIRVGNSKLWKPATTEEIHDILKKNNSKSNQKSKQVETGVAFGVLALGVVIVAVVIVKRRKRRPVLI